MVLHSVRKLASKIRSITFSTINFFAVFLLYMWSCVISLYQILSIVNTHNYKSLYGDDPLTEWTYNEKTALTDGKKMEVENVKFFPSSDFYSPIKMNGDKSNNRLVTTISLTSPTDIFEKDFSNLQNHMGSRNRLIGMVFFNGENRQQKF